MKQTKQVEHLLVDLLHCSFTKKLTLSGNQQSNLPPNKSIQRQRIGVRPELQVEAAPPSGRSANLLPGGRPHAQNRGHRVSVLVAPTGKHEERGGYPAG